jgi:hypothetical protein
MDHDRSSPAPDVKREGKSLGKWQTAEQLSKKHRQELSQRVKDKETMGRGMGWRKQIIIQSSFVWQSHFGSSWVCHEALGLCIISRGFGRYSSIYAPTEWFQVYTGLFFSAQLKASDKVYEFFFPFLSLPLVSIEPISFFFFWP